MHVCIQSLHYNTTQSKRAILETQVMRNTLYKAYLDDFAKFCQSLGGTTSEVMGDLLAFEVRHGEWEVFGMQAVLLGAVMWLHTWSEEDLDCDKSLGGFLHGICFCLTTQ